LIGTRLDAVGYDQDGDDVGKWMADLFRSAQSSSMPHGDADR
jgi:hypothetical protein